MRQTEAELERMPELDASPATFDVAVMGGGSAGLAAAISSARSGAETILIEQQSRLGGMGTNAQVHTFCGLFHPDVSREPKWLNDGLPREIGEALLRQSARPKPDLAGRVYILRHDPARFASIASELCKQESNLTLSLRTRSEHVTHTDAGWRLNAVGEHTTTPVVARALIDTTGDAVVARTLGDSFYLTTPPERLYRPGYIATWTHIVRPLDDADKLQLASVIVRAVRDSILPSAAMGASFRNGSSDHDIHVSIDLEAGAEKWNPLDPVSVSAVQAEGKKIMTALWAHVRENHPAFSSETGLLLPDQLGVRESIRWRGDHILTAAELIACTRFDDEVALAGWPLEKRESARGPKFEYFAKAEPAGIPSRCLKNSDLPGLFFAGRCLSCDHEALASLRVMGTCLATGQAAGRMAAAYALR